MIKRFIYRFIQLKNWYWPNYYAIDLKRINLRLRNLRCSQSAIFFGKGKLIVGGFDFKFASVPHVHSENVLPSNQSPSDVIIGGIPAKVIRII